MYLTRFRVNTTRGGAKRLLSSPRALHAAVMTSFPAGEASLPSPETTGSREATPTSGTLPDEGTGAPRVLWRTDRNARAETHLHIVSPTEPDLDHLVQQAGWPQGTGRHTPGWQTCPYAPFLSRLTKGESWIFRLTANPVHGVRRHPGERAKRTAHLTPRHQLRWLLQRQEHCGFRLLHSADAQALHLEERYAVTVHSRRQLSFAHPSPAPARPARSQPKATLVTTTFDGRLEVTDPEALRRTLTCGLGKAKAYGCGLMTLSPLPR
ncbi:type I-E CRISPR-associated protein Cas6/Cse3/CasE [Streptomyces sp. XM4193]|uniref:type I-E CRISPR-associated protein Cas6/Cse3/CasE n=1 Tax=Streptomyces sp. XM4193 TaxID=2929782 RepID=UPI001FFB4151|nr:type I-E CRISPR-associated protein Cas6/Cse3/CasE [Streptomyces sp. XM4193]MCK1797580.1 type I-E CRISPR-associated protein Cas6/Cse3/CasE [Streptomyces sp. XM4193]